MKESKFTIIYVRQVRTSAFRYNPWLLIIHTVSSWAHKSWDKQKVTRIKDNIKTALKIPIIFVSKLSEPPGWSIHALELLMNWTPCDSGESNIMSANLSLIWAGVNFSIIFLSQLSMLHRHCIREPNQRNPNTLTNYDVMFITSKMRVIWMSWQKILSLSLCYLCRVLHTSCQIEYTQPSSDVQKSGGKVAVSLTWRTGLVMKHRDVATY